MARVAFDTLREVYEGFFGNALVLKCVRIYETPNCWAEVTADPIA
jgi:6-pyruvoyltetrahydropterin/6-carboxytetrahydropterin synthase